MNMTTPAARHRIPTILTAAASMLAVIVLVSVQSNAQSRYSHPSDLNMNNEFQGGIRQYLACSQTHFEWGEGRQIQLTKNRDFLLSSLSSGVTEININPPILKTPEEAGKTLAKFLRALDIILTALDVRDMIELLNDKFVVSPAWRRQNKAWYEEMQTNIDEQVIERVRECARIQMQFNLGGGTAVWGGLNSWTIRYSDFNGTTEYSMPRLREGIVTIQEVRN